MKLSPEQIKVRIKNLAKNTNADSRTLMTAYMMERFLERIASSNYKDNFVIKGGFLVTSMIGVSLRSTMDIDTSITGYTLSKDEVQRVITDISSIDMGDDVTFEIKDISKIMDAMEYPGIRVSMNAYVGNMVTPIKIDISTGDAITPRAIEYHYKPLLKDRAISLWSYNLETILAEKLQTVLARGILNTRMRDLYDIYMLFSIYKEKIDYDVLDEAFSSTCRKRQTSILRVQGEDIIETIVTSEELRNLWRAYRKKYSYAREFNYDDVIQAIRKLFLQIK